VATIERPVGTAIARESLQDRILYIVLTKGVPLRIDGSTGGEGTTSSVDSELTLLYQRMLTVPTPTIGRLKNPYFLDNRDISEARHFTHRDYGIYLVSRLDAFTIQEATDLIDAGLAPSTEGAVVLDEREALTNTIGDKWIGAAADRLGKSASNTAVVLETTPRAATASGPVLGYASWGATDPQLQRRGVGLRFVKGSLAMTLAGDDARTLRAPPADWAPMKDPGNRATWFGGSPQSLVGDLIREGATGVAGSVAEPFLEGVPRPDIVLPAYMAGFNLIESFYLGVPFLSWETVVIGDPLCGPFVKEPIAHAELDSPIDADTELPSLFSARRLAIARALMKSHQSVAPMLIRIETRLAHGDVAGARMTLEDVVKAAPTLVGPQLELAMMDDRAGDRHAAEKRYQRIIELEPDNALALNNLAFDLAMYEHDAAAAKPLADRAVAASKRNATVVDTLGWIEHLLGHDDAAAMLLDEAVMKASENADIRIHAAIVAAARGLTAQAETHLQEALKRNPALASRRDVIELQTALKNAPPASPAR
jgi:uncharacterized protein (TIGR03790 family)